MKEKVRYLSADLLRGLVIIIMIEVHVFNTFLITDLKESHWFSVLNFINGLVAPSFLFVSGFAFQVSSDSKLDEMRKFGKAFRKKMMRIFQIIIIGYVLHLPFYSLSKMINELNQQTLESFLIVDVLQCIGFGLLFLFLTRLLIKSDKAYNCFLISSLIIITFVSPVVWKIELTNYLPLAVANYFNRLHGSLFPLFPWVTFLLAGAVFAKYFVDARAKDKEEIFIKYSAIAGFAVLLSGHLFYSGLFPKTLTSIIPNPVFYLERLGYIFILFFLCWMADRKTNIKKSFIMDASRESLLIYWLHLIIIFGTFWKGKSLALIIGTTFNTLEAISVTIILIIMMIFAAKIWGGLKQKYPKHASVFVKAAVIILIIVFILN